MEREERGASMKNMKVLRTLTQKWWFWIVVIPLLAWGAWEAFSYYRWAQHFAPYFEHNRATAEYYKWKEKEHERMEELYRNDTYGGSTPEETLELFIEALEDKNLELAAKYFLPEKQQEALIENQEAEPEGNERLITAYLNGVVVTPRTVGASGIYEIEIYESSTDTVPFRVRLIKNKFTEKWKIEQL